MPTIRLIVRYDGTGFSGWQRQRNAPSVQQALEEAAASMAGGPIRIHGAGRTDAGVHALRQVASFRTDAKIPPRGWQLGLTSRLPPTVSVLEAREVPDGFDPRRASAGKRYRYLLLASRMRDPLLRDRAWHVHAPLDLDAMREGARALIGTHDFRGFRAADCERVSTVRQLWRAEWLRGYAGVEALLAFEVEGSAFLKNMVRIVVGTLVDVGRGRLAPSIVSALLASGDRTRAGITAPPQGLYLDEVFVRPEFRLDDDSLALRPAAGDVPLGKVVPHEARADDDEPAAG